MAARHAPAQPRCPRCGYDLAGEIATWRERCPLTGRCPECGLELDWGRVVALAVHPWLFEYNWRRRPLRRLLRTWREALRPPRFWRDVRLTDPVHLGPLLLVVGGTAVLVCGMIVAALAVVGAQTTWIVPGIGMRRPSVLHLLVESSQTALWVQIHVVPGPLLAAIAMPLAFVLLPQTLRRARVRRGHVLRVWLYSLFAPLTVSAVWAVLALNAVLLDLPALAAALNPLEWARALRWRSFPLIGANSGAVPGTAILVLLMWWLARWWSIACRSYLRLPRSRAVVLALSLVVGLAALAVQWWVWLLTGRSWL